MKSVDEKFDLFANNISFYLPDRQYDDDLEKALDVTVEWVKNTGQDLTAARLYELMEENPVETFHFVRLATGISMESLKNLFVAPRMLSRGIREEIGVAEWPDKYRLGKGTLIGGLKESKEIRQGMARLFIHGKNINPAFCQKEEQRKYSIKTIHDLAQSPDSTIRRTIEGRIATTFRNQKSLRHEEIVRKLLKEMNIPYASGISEDLLRNMDCLVPTRENPDIAIECTWFNTTASGQGDKARTFARTVELMKEKNPNLKVYLFVDGAGWLRRSSDLKVMLEAADDVFTYRRSQLRRFVETIKSLKSPEAA